MTKIAFIISSLDSSETRTHTKTYAELNQKELNNDSIIIYQESKDNYALLEAFKNFPLIDYKNKEHLEEIIFERKINLICYFCDTLNNMLPASTPSYIHCSDKNIPAFGDIFHTDEKFNLKSSPSAKEFDEKCIRPTLKMVPTIGYLYNNTIGIFMGNKDPGENITVFKLQEPSLPSLELPIKEQIIEEQKEEVKEIPIQTKELTSIEILKNTIDIIKSELIQKQTEQTTVNVKLLCNWTSSSQLIQDWSKMLKKDKIHPIDIKIVQDGKIDYYIIINKPPTGEHFEPEKTIVFLMEPYIEDSSYFNDWLQGIDKSKFLYFLDHTNFRNNTEWWLNKTIEELQSLQPIEKTQLLSTVVSSQYTMKGHKLRVNFLKYFQSHSNIAIDVFGHDNNFNLADYKGSLPSREKDQGIFPYKYHFAAENSDIPNYFTEKFNDAIIGECLLFYWGCSNIEDHINPNAFIRLPLDDTLESMINCTKIIEESIENNEWSKRIDIIRQEKNKIINQYNFFNRVSSLVYCSKIYFYHLIKPNNELLSIPGIKIHPILLTQNISIECIRKNLRYYIPPIIQLPQLGRLMDHFNLWKICSEENRINCILESNPNPNFLDNLTTILSVEQEWDIIFFSWNPVTSTNEITYRTLLTPCWEHIKNHISNIVNPQGENVKYIDPGYIGNGYLLHPRMAKKLVEIVDKYGFFTNLDELFILLHTMIPNIKTFITQKNIISTLPSTETESYHIFHKIPNGQYSNCQQSFTYPPVEERDEIILLSNDEFKQSISLQPNL